MIDPIIHPSLTRLPAALCDDHTAAVLGLIDIAGLGHLSAHTDPVRCLAAHTARRETQEITVDNFEPYGMTISVLTRSLANSVGGGTLLGAVLAGGGCVVCIANRMHLQFCREQVCEFTFDSFIGATVDVVAATWQELNQ